MFGFRAKANPSPFSYSTTSMNAKIDMITSVYVVLFMLLLRGAYTFLSVSKTTTTITKADHDSLGSMSWLRMGIQLVAAFYTAVAATMGLMAILRQCRANAAKLANKHHRKKKKERECSSRKSEQAGEEGSRTKEKSCASSLSSRAGNSAASQERLEVPLTSAKPSASSEMHKKNHKENLNATNNNITRIPPHASEEEEEKKETDLPTISSPQHHTTTKTTTTTTTNTPPPNISIPPTLRDMTGNYKVASKQNFRKFLECQGVHWTLSRAADTATNNAINRITHDMQRHTVTIRAESSVISSETTYVIGGPAVQTKVRGRGFWDQAKYLEEGDGIRIHKVLASSSSSLSEEEENHGGGKSEGKDVGDYRIMVERRLSSCGSSMKVTSTAIFSNGKEVQSVQVFKRID